MNSTRPSGQELPRAGEIVAGKYRIDSVIGEGGMGVVLGAEDTSLGRKVAMKFLAPQKADRDGATARFAREARAAASIQSENVVRVFEVGTLPSGASYIVMEHLIGADLAQTLQTRGPLPFDEAVDYLLQACEAIGEAHGRGIVHRDLKPQNLFLTHRPDGTACVKVLDFGISKAIEEEAPNLTSTNMVMGTPLYMSPEQVRSLKNVDQRSDIWAMGAILFELLTAAPIFEAATVTALCAMIAMDPPIPLRARRPESPPELEGVILRCLHKDPHGRFQDVAALAEALAPFASERGRASIARVVRVVRAGAQQGGYAGASPSVPTGTSPYGTTSDANPALAHAAQAPAAGWMPMTAGAGQSLPPGAMSGSGAGAALSYPPQAAPYGTFTTQQTWQKPAEATAATDPRAPRRSSAAVVALLGAGAGVVLFGLVGGGGYLVYARKATADETAKARASDTATVAAGIQAPPSSALASATAAPTVTIAAVTGTAKKGAAAAASAAAQKDGGAAPSAKPNDELEGQKRIAAGECSHMQFLLRSNDTKNNDNVKQVKTLMCLRASSPQGVTCQRTVCRQACATLNDSQCLFQLDNAERNFPPRF